MYDEGRCIYGTGLSFDLLGFCSRHTEGGLCHFLAFSCGGSDKVDMREYINWMARFFFVANRGFSGCGYFQDY